MIVSGEREHDHTRSYQIANSICFTFILCMYLRKDAAAHHLVQRIIGYLSFVNICHHGSFSLLSLSVRDQQQFPHLHTKKKSEASAVDVHYGLGVKEAEMLIHGVHQRLDVARLGGETDFIHNTENH